MQISRCGIHGFHEVLGIDTDEIRFYWAIESNERDAVQVAYRIVVTTDAKYLESDIPDCSTVWDSQRVESNEQRNIICNPPNGFQSTCSHFWKVIVWDQAGNAYHSAVNHFFTAYPRSHLFHRIA